MAKTQTILQLKRQQHQQKNPEMSYAKVLRVIRKQKPIRKTTENSTISAFMKNIESYEYKYDKETF